MELVELIVTPKGAKFLVQDKKERVIYTIKKKGFGANRNVILDASGYELYEIRGDFSSKHPEFSITLNGKEHASVLCKSLFLDPSMQAKTPEGEFWIKTKDRKLFTIYKDKEQVGKIELLQMIGGSEPQFALEMQDIYFDAYMPLFVIGVMQSFYRD